MDQDATRRSKKTKTWNWCSVNEYFWIWVAIRYIGSYFIEDLGGGKDSVVQCSPVGLGLGELRIGISEIIFRGCVGVSPVDQDATRRSTKKQKKRGTGVP